MSVEEKAQTLDIKGVIITLVVSAFGFVAALFWRDAIKAFIEELIPEGQGLAYQFGVAVLVTVIAVIAIYFVTKHLSKVSIKHVKGIKGKVSRIDNMVLGKDVKVRKKGG